MSLESIVKPVKWVDEQVLRQYAKLGKKFNLDEGRRKYTAGMGFWLAFAICSGSGYKLFGPLEWSIYMPLSVTDFSLNLDGLTGLEDKKSNGEISIDPRVGPFKKVSASARLPVLVAGAGLVGKFGIDFYRSVLGGEPISDQDYNCFVYGVGLLSLATSMYLKDADPKILEKESGLNKVYQWARKKMKQIAPEPIAGSGMARTYAALEEL